MDIVSMMENLQSLRSALSNCQSAVECNLCIICLQGRAPLQHTMAVAALTIATSTYQMRYGGHG